MISVVIPVKDGGRDLVRCLQAIAIQQVDQEVEVLVVDSGSADGSPETAHRLGARVHEIPPEDFNHGATRNLGARLAKGSILVFTTQDAYAENADWLTKLVAPLGDDPRIAGVYGRQIPHDGASPPEHYFLDFLYGAEPRIQELEPPEELTFKATLFSNVNSAIPRPVWEEHPFPEDVTMSEDQAWSRKLLLNGRTIVYEPTATVRHSHAYSVARAFRRFFDSGASAEHSYDDGSPASRRALRSAASEYARGELAWLWGTGQRRWIPYAALYETAKFAGLQLGIRHRYLPLSLKRRLSGMPQFWERV